MTKQEFLTIPLSLALPGDKPDYNQVVDTVFDALRAGAIIEDQLSDGFQWTDLFGLRSLPDIVSEIVADVPDFLKQITKLEGDEAVNAINEAKAKLIANVKPGKVVGFIIQVLTVLAKGYKSIDELHEEIMALIGKE